MTSPATNDFRSSGAVSWFIQHVMTLAGFIAALVPGLALIKPNVDYEMTLMLLAHGLSVATGAVAFHSALVNFRALTGARLMPSWSTLVVGYGPLALVLMFGFALLSPTMNAYLRIAASIGGIALYCGWVLAALAWPVLWSRLLGVRADGSVRPSHLARLTAWAAFCVSSASFVAQYLKYMGVGALAAQVVSSALQIIGILVAKQLVQDLEVAQVRVAKAKGVAAPRAPSRVLIRLPPNILWTIIFVSLALYSATLTLDANRLFAWF